MPEKEQQFFKPGIRERGPEEWAKEIPVETFGTEEERRQNLERLMGELGELRQEQGISEEEFKERLGGAEKFLESMPLVHGTSLKTIAEIFLSSELLSVAELERRGRPVEFGSGTYEVDRKAGLNKFIYMSNGVYGACGEAYIVFYNHLLDRPDCFVTGEDIVTIPHRLQDLEKKPFPLWGHFPEQYPKIFEECLTEYRKQVISGKNFRDFLANFIATHHKNPEDYLVFRDKDYGWGKENFKDLQILDRQGQRIPFYPKEWYNPEIKISTKIPVRDIWFVMVDEMEDKHLLQENGVPSSKIIRQLDFGLTGRGPGPFLRLRF